MADNTSPPGTPPPATAGLPRSGAQRGTTHDGTVDLDPLGLGAGGVDAMPDGVRQPPQPGNIFGGQQVDNRMKGPARTGGNFFGGSFDRKA